MRIISRKALRDFAAKHPNAEAPLNEWYAHAHRAEWKSMQDIKNDFASASFVGDSRVVFNIGGNNYRLIVVALLNAGQLLIKFVGTHAEYDRIDATKV